MGQMWWGRRVLLSAVCATASALTAASLSAEEQTTASAPTVAKPKSYAAANAAAERIEAALDQKLRAPLSEVEAPLNQILMVIAEDYDIPIIFDAAALDAVAASPEVEVSIEINNVSLRSALDLILKNAGEDLTYIIDKEVLFITTQEEAEKRLEVRVYVVGDLVREASSLVWNEDDGFDSLINAIISTVERESWLENGTGEGEIQPLSPGMLVVAQTRRVHEQIGDLLQQIREAKSEVNTEASEQQAAAANRPVLRSIAFSDEATAKCEETRNQLSEVIKKSVDWDREAEGGGDLVLQVLPNRVLVRHVPEVVEEVARVVQHVFPATQMFHCTGGGAGMGGAVGGASGSAGAAAATPAASAPELAESPAGGENGEQRQPSGFGGF
ncbi:STN domain-containing protein [Lacipirellula parvula]|uniref:NolW-like domain-containing protein n=1 Tax=Lacipirellula parvula TaxID=2650471 RepID=A0A5K7XCS7_9BACT|nr:STN domain-containing protein [Lacipirellula parvula]BBO30899.1 hypothetical protein PLANPX_0511 [Lacipirellula parvula]